MSTAAEVFEVTHENEVKRETDRARYDQATISSILTEAPFVHVAFVDEDSHPQCVPMVAAADWSCPDGPLVYLHGYHRARIVRLLPPETRVCVTATLCDGLVLALSAFSSSINYRSAVLHGEVLPWDADGEDEDGPVAEAARWEAARRIVEGVMPDRWDNCRQPTQAEMATTGFVKVRVLSASAKVRTGGPGDEKRDLRDEDLTGRVWAGVVPVRTTYGTPEPTELCKLSPPGYITDYVAREGKGQGLSPSGPLG